MNQARKAESGHTIIFVTGSFSTRVGGRTASIFSRAKLFQEMGYHVCIASRDIQPAYRGIFASLCRVFGLSGLTFLNMYEFYAQEEIYGLGAADDPDAESVTTIKKGPSVYREILSDRTGAVYRIKTLGLDNAKYLEEDFTPNGRVYLSVHPDYRGSLSKYVWARKDGNNPVTFNSRKDLFAYWFAHLSKQYENPIFFAEQHGADLALIHNPYVEKPLKVITTLHTSLFVSPYTYGSPLLPEVHRIVNHVEEYAAVVTITDQERMHIANYVGVHPNCVTITHPVKVSASASSVVAVPNRIVMCSRLTASKRIDDAIRAVVLAHREVPDIEFLIYGVGEEEDRLRRLIRELHAEHFIKLEGYTETPLEMFASAALSLSTSCHEGLSLSILESLSEGTPVIAYDFLYGPRYLIDNGVNGIIVENGNYEALAREMAALLNDSARLERMSSAARVLKPDFHLFEIRSRWERLFASIDAEDIPHAQAQRFSAVTAATILEVQHVSDADSRPTMRVRCTVTVDAGCPPDSFYLLFGDCQRIDIRDELYVQGRVVNHEESTYTVDFAVDGTKEELDALLGDCSNLRVEAQFGKHAAIATLDAGR